MTFNSDLAKEIIDTKRGRILTTYDSEAHITGWQDPHWPDYPLSGWVSGLYEEECIDLRWDKQGICMYDQKYNLHIKLYEKLDEQCDNLLKQYGDLLDFDIEMATLAINCGTGRVVTRNGRPVTITGYDESMKFAVEGVFSDVGTLGFWGKDGKFNPDNESESGLDLFIEELV